MSLKGIKIGQFPCKEIAKGITEQFRESLAGTEFDDLTIKEPEMAIVRANDASAYTIDITRKGKALGNISIYQDKKGTNIGWHCEQANKAYLIDTNDLSLLATRVFASREASL